MLTDEQIILCIAGMATVTYLPRVLPMALLASRPLNPALARWLGFVSASVLAALLAPDLLLRDGALDLSTPSSLPKSTHTFHAGMRASGKGSTRTTVPARISTASKSSQVMVRRVSGGDATSCSPLIRPPVQAILPPLPGQMHVMHGSDRPAAPPLLWLQQ